MILKNLAIGIALACLLSLGSGQARAAEGQCAELLGSVCIGCHDSERVCAKIGGPEKKWVGLLKWMIANGAELEEEDKTLLINCMTEPYAEAKAFCGK